MWKTVLAVGLATLVGVIGGWFVMRLSYSNAEIRLRNQYNAQLETNNASFDKTWKIIKQQAEVPEVERESFKNTYVEIMNATEGVAGRGMLASFFTQAKIDITPELFSKLMTTIEAQRETFFRDQKKLAEIWQQHNNALTTEPSSWFVGGREPIKLVIVTSSVTKEAFSAGEENDVSLFDKSK